MSPRLATFLAGLGTAVALAQCWYVSLPPDVAARIDVCRTPYLLDCFESLHRQGESMLHVHAALAAVLFLILELRVAARFAAPARGAAWAVLAGILSFPAAGLAVYVLLNDFIVVRLTSPSSALLGLLCLALAARTVLRGLAGAKLKEGAGTAALLAGAALLLGFFAFGAAGARRESARVELERQEAPPQVRWAEFAPEIPREGAATLGDPLAPVELLLFVDPAQEESRGLMRAAADLAAPDVLLVFYAPGDAGARLVLAHRQGELARVLRDPAAAIGGDLAPLRPLVARQSRAAMVETYPTVLWKGGRKTGAVDLRAIVAQARLGQ